jgi:hypothetical protein
VANVCDNYLRDAQAERTLHDQSAGSTLNGRLREIVAISTHPRNAEKEGSGHHLAVIKGESLNLS